MAGKHSSILVIADPGAPAAIAERLSDSLPDELTGGPTDDRWAVSVRRNAYPIDEHTGVSEVIGAIEPGGENEDIVIYLTDLPRRDGTTPVIADISVPDAFGVIYLPGLGGAFIGRRVRKLAGTIVAEVTCRPRKQEAPAKRLTRIQDIDVVHYVAPSALSRLRLLAGMVYANRPWRLVTGMSKVMMAAFATGAVSLAYPTIWQLSATMGPWRLSAATIDVPHGSADRAASDDRGSGLAEAPGFVLAIPQEARKTRVRSRLGRGSSTPSRSGRRRCRRARSRAH